MLAGMDDHDHTHAHHDHARQKPALMDPRRGPFRSQRVYNDILATILSAPPAEFDGIYAYCQLGKIGDFVR